MNWDALFIKNAGRVLKIFSLFLLLLGFIGSIIIAHFFADTYFYYDEELIAGFIIFLSVFITILVETLLMFAFGQIAEDVHKIAAGKQSKENSDNSELPVL
ncbi:MAG: hypothetical protein IK116_04830 [Firmicutes bacterium]|nr:hypothetical protein [Bacillota bacterium]